LIAIYLLMSSFNSQVLTQLVQKSAVVEISPKDGEGVQVYSRGKPDSMFTLILQGHLKVTSGPEEFLSSRCVLVEICIE